MLALLTGYDGGTLAELRGIYAWLACLYEEEAATLIRRDPLGLVLYGDASKLSTSGKRMVIDCLRDLAIKNPGFRIENWSAEPFGALASPDMVPVFKKVLSDEAETPHLLGCILDAIVHGPPLPDLGDDLIRIVRDNARLEGTRVFALDAYQHVCPTDTVTLRILLDDIHLGRVHDEHHRLRGKIFYALYPVTIRPHEIGQYLVLPVEPHVNAYTMFVSHELVRLTKPRDLPLLFTGIDAKTMAGSPQHLIWVYFFGRLILQILQHLGENVSSSQLYEWLGKALDQYGGSVADRKEAAAIQSWLIYHPAVVKGLFRHWFSVTPFDKPWVEVIYFWRRLHSVAPPEGFHRWLLSLAEREPDPARAEFLFREAVQGSTSLCEDGPTLDELFQCADRDSRFHDPLRMALCCDVESWQQEDAKRRRTDKKRAEAKRALRIQQLSELLETIRSGAPTQALNILAKVYFGLFYDVDRDAPPKDRLVTFANPEIAATALDGFVAALGRPDIPSPKMIGEAQAEGQDYLLGFPVLAGLDVLATKSLADVRLLPAATLQSGLAFHYAIVSDREREWVDPLIESMPDLAAEALMAYWRPLLTHNLKNIMGLYALVHEDMMKPVAKRVALILLKDYPNAQEDSLELFLHAALRDGDRTELLSHAHHVISHQTPLTDDNKSLWYAVAFALDHESAKSGLEEHIRGKAEQAARILNFLCPSHGIKSDTPYPLPVAALGSLIAMMGPIFHPRNLSGSGYLAIRGPEGAASSIQSLIHSLAKELTYEASLALAELRDDPALTAWHPEIACVLADQARQRRELAFQYPTVAQVIETLNQGRPANAADLQALVNSHLHAISAELRDGPTDGWKGMWNVDGYGNPTQARPENDCRNRLLDLLRPRLFPFDVAAEPEGHYAEAKRADIKAVIGSINLPVEIKRHFHTDLWTAPRDQLKKLYARDPGTAGRGIYLVFWFGTEVKPVPKPPNGSPQIQTPAQLEAALLKTLQSSSERVLLEIIVY